VENGVKMENKQKELNFLKNKLIKLRKENKELKHTLEIMSDAKLIKKINKAIEDIKKGRYFTEEEFLKKGYAKMSEPLKNKERYLGTGRSIDDRIFKKKDIKFAVEWLKQEIRVEENWRNWKRMIDGKSLIHLIDEAFEDVTKK
jgi:hypothetical protein